MPQTDRAAQGHRQAGRPKGGPPCDKGGGGACGAVVATPLPLARAAGRDGMWREPLGVWVVPTLLCYSFWGVL